MQVGAALPVLLCCLGQALGQAVPGIEAWQAAIQAHAQAGHHVHPQTKEDLQQIRAGMGPLE